MYSKDAAKEETLEEIARLTEIFPQEFNQTLQNLQNDPMYNIFQTSSESEMAKLCEQNEQVSNYFKTLMVKCFGNNKISSTEGRELFFHTVHNIRTDKNTIDDGVTVLQKIASNKSYTDINNFIQIVVLELIGELIKACTALEKKKSKT